MNLLLFILDVYSAISIIFCMYFVRKYNKVWLIYAFGCIPWAILKMLRGCPGLVLTGIILFFVGINNYCKGKK